LAAMSARALELCVVASHVAAAGDLAISSLAADKRDADADAFDSAPFGFSDDALVRVEREPCALRTLLALVSAAPLHTVFVGGASALLVVVGPEHRDAIGVVAQHGPCAIGVRPAFDVEGVSKRPRDMPTEPVLQPVARQTTLTACRAGASLPRPVNLGEAPAASARKPDRGITPHPLTIDDYRLSDDLRESVEAHVVLPGGVPREPKA
jgi:hypothetical protein